MPQVVTHLLIPIILVSIFRDFYLRKRDRSKFPLHYVLIAGLGGILPDLDVAAFWILHFFDFTYWEVHKIFMHSLALPVILLLLYLLTSPIKIPELGKHKLRLNKIFLLLAIGSLIHVLLDVVLGNMVSIIYPLSTIKVGINLVGLLPDALQSLAAPTLDAALLIIYLIYLEVKHKISNFI